MAEALGVRATCLGHMVARTRSRQSTLEQRVRIHQLIPGLALGLGRTAGHARGLTSWFVLQDVA
jgi:hypothetical protein